jgi:hypothetical protein
MMKFPRILPFLAALFCASTGTALAAVPAAPFSDNFSSYPLKTCFAETTAFGPWTSVLNGSGCNQVEADGVSIWLDAAPQASVSASETHAALTTGPALASPLTISVDMQTSAQLRQNDPPNAWEVGWLLWDYADNAHFYYFQPRPNGWELGKEDPTYPGSQRLLASGTSPVFPIGAWHTVKIVQVQNSLTVYVNGQLIVDFPDTETPYTSGNVGLYNEDSDARFTNFSVIAATSAAAALSVSSAPWVSSLGPSAATINWTTAAPGDSQVQFGPTASYASLTAPDVSAKTNHSIVLSGLSAGTIYHYAAMSRDASGILTIAADSIFTTLLSTASAAVPASTSIDSQAKAPQKFLSPGLADGINDVATFGPNAEEVTIYDIKGRLVYHASQQGGAPIVWNCKDGSGRIDASGVYIAKIKTNGSGVLYQSFALVK